VRKLERSLQSTALSSGRSRLRIYVREHLSEIKKNREKFGSSWDDVATAIAADGQLDKNGRPPSGEAVRRAYLKVVEGKNL
jgi:hypothetical protein